MVRAFIALILFVGCGGSTGGVNDAGAVTAQQAQSDCEQFVSMVYCPSFMRCLSGFTMDDCLATLPGFDCSAVKGENGHLPTCEAQIEAATCKQLVGDGTMAAIPTSCTGVFLF